MNRYLVLFVFLLGFPLVVFASQGEQTVLSAEERQNFEKIVRLYPDFKYTNNVVWENGVADMVFDRSEGLIFGEMVGYSVSFHRGSSCVEYEFDYGTALRGSGTFCSVGSRLIKTELSCGMTCTLRMFDNGTEVYSKSL